MRILINTADFFCVYTLRSHALDLGITLIGCRWQSFDRSPAVVINSGGSPMALTLNVADMFQMPWPRRWNPIADGTRSMTAALTEFDDRRLLSDQNLQALYGHLFNVLINTAVDSSPASVTQVSAAGCGSCRVAVAGMHE